MKRVLFINSAVYLPGEGGYKRTMFLFDMMNNLGYDVTLLTGDFNHYSKTARNVERFYENYPQYNNIVMLPKRSYTKNISIKRYFSDVRFSSVTEKWVRGHIQDYDVVYMNMPNINAVIKISKLCIKARIPLLLDIRDLHPEALHVVFKNKYVYSVLTWPMKLMANKAYKCADEFIAVSKEYLDRGLSVNRKSKHPRVVYIGATLNRFDEGVKKYSTEVYKPYKEIWITYVGTIGVSYDFITIIDAVEELNVKNKINVRLKILGQGPEEEKLKIYCKKNKIFTTDFLGFMDYERMAAFLSASDFALNNIKKNASQSIINKTADYFAAGIPTLNSCKNKEMKWLIEHYETGLNYEAENKADFIKTFLELYNDQKRMKQFGVNARKLAISKFDRANSYKKIIEIIENVEFQG